MNLKILFFIFVSLFKDILLFLSRIHLHSHTEASKEFRDVTGEVDFQKFTKYVIEKKNLRLFRLFFSMPAYVVLYLLSIPKLEKIILIFDSEFLRVYFLLLAIETFLFIITLPKVI